MATQQPNIVVLMADQMIPMMTGAYGHPSAHTPNIDRLSQEGVTFDNAYSTCPVCVPARISMLTGMYGASINCYDNGATMGSEVPTHNHYLNLAGYETVLSGKAHFIGPDQLRGFQKRTMTDIFPANFNFMPFRNENLDPSNLHPNPIAVDYLGENVGVVQSSMQIDFDEEAVFHALTYLSGKRTQMTGTAQKEKPPRDETPFFLQVSLTHPHEPFHVRQEHWDLYEGVDIPVPEYPDNLEELYTSFDRTLNKLHGVDRVEVKDPASLRRVHRAYLAAVSYVDEKVGVVLDALERFGLTDDTIVIFLSDHGDMLGHRGMIQKRCFYEHSSRIPLIVRSPKNHPLARSGHRAADPVSITDFAPTVLELAGITDYLPMDGHSLVPQLEGESDPQRYVYCENLSEGTTRVCFMVRRDTYKYTSIQGGEAQLFNVEEDPLEWNDLSGRPGFEKLEGELQSLITGRFDIEALDRDAQQRFERRMVIRNSIKKTGLPSWNYKPPMDVDNMYWRED